VPEQQRDQLNIIGARNRFYRDGHRTFLWLALAQGLAIVVLLTALTIQLFFTPPVVQYFGVNEKGSLIPLTPLNQPILTNAAVLSWTTSAASEIMTFGFQDYRRRFQESSRHFTRNGWQNYMDAVVKSGLIDAVQTRKQVLSAVPSAAPVIVRNGLVNGVYTWDIQLPMVITTESLDQKQTTRQLLNLRVVRVSPLDSPNAIGIEQWIATEN
jgi:intracellular multiplication protein IcmL